MRRSKSGNKYTKRNRSMRRHIGEVLLRKLEKEDFSEISITDLSSSANISRMTFYKYYSTKEEVLEDYIYESIYEITDNRQINSLTDMDRLLKKIEVYKRPVLTLIENNIGYIIQNAINTFVSERQDKKYIASFIIGGLYSTYLTWLGSATGFSDVLSEIKEFI